jgi:hypothetical protein
MPADEWITCSKGGCQASCHRTSLQDTVQCVCEESDAGCECWCAHSFTDIKSVSKFVPENLIVKPKTLDSVVSVCIHDAPLVTIANILSQKYSFPIDIPATKAFEIHNLSLDKVTLSELLQALGLKSSASTGSSFITSATSI